MDIIIFLIWRTQNAANRTPLIVQPSPPNLSDLTSCLTNECFFFSSPSSSLPFLMLHWTTSFCPEDTSNDLFISTGPDSKSLEKVGDFQGNSLPFGSFTTFSFPLNVITSVVCPEIRTRDKLSFISNFLIKYSCDDYDDDDVKTNGKNINYCLRFSLLSFCCPQ